MPAPKPAPSIYQLKITLLEIAPPIWRRLQVRSTIWLCCLHSALQVTMGWTDSHLHEFGKGKRRWGIPQYKEDEADDVMNDSRVRLDTILNIEGETMTYLYDFGDCWRHAVVLEKIIPPDGSTKPVCIAGERRCPPEDVGGSHGYQESSKVIFQPGHEEFEHYRQWAGEAVHAEEFNLKAVNDTLERMRWPVRHRR